MHNGFLQVRMHAAWAWLAVVLLFVGPAAAGMADVVAVDMIKTGDTYRVDVSVRHADAGWEHYANKWDVVAPDGSLLGTRVLLHPHDNEQPFTRSLGGVIVPEAVDFVIIRAHDILHGPGGKEQRVEVPR